MEAPYDLNAHGRRAFDVACETTGVDSESHRFYDAAIRFARAVQMAELVRADWISHGSPLLFTHSNGAVVPHPLVKLLSESEKEAARSGRALKLEPEAVKRATPGRPPGSGSSPDRKAPPVLKLAAK
jgi:hypothetical protein